MNQHHSLQPGSDVAEPLDTLRFPLWGSRLIEASAGTGKTYTIAGLYLRLVLGHGELPESRALTPPDILVVTFTRAATQELRDRIRTRLTQAADFFLGDGEGDDFLSDLRGEYPEEQWASCARRLQIAAEWMDDAAVSTIDAWCYRMLREHAFESSGLFEVEMDVEEAARVAEATRDYWRLFLAPLAPCDMERVLKVIASNRADSRSVADCDGLADLLRRRWLAQVDHYAEGVMPSEAMAQVQTGSEACKAPWRTWVPELRELLQAASDAGDFHKNKMRAPHWSGWLDKLEEWAGDPQMALPFKRNIVAWTRLTPEGLAEVWKQGDPPDHPALTAMLTLAAEIDALDVVAASWLPHAARWVAQRIEELRRQRGTLGFGGLLRQLDTALAGPGGAALADAIRNQFPVALVDEFQDTSPVQYRIFDRIYNVSANRRETLLALIGDPKQAIYRFRGADIHAYLTARRDCGGRLYTLGRNFRSSPAMVKAVNHVFGSAEESAPAGAFLFGDADEDGANSPVPFLPVIAAADPGTWMVDGAPAAALTVWRELEVDGREACAIQLAEACASEIRRLLQLGREGRAGVQTDSGFRPLHAGDIAILVNNRNEAARLRAALGRRGIRSVYLSDDASVFRSAAANDVLAWLRACAEPESGGYVRAALASGALGLSWNQLDAYVRDDVLWEHALARFADYKEQWRRRGVLPMLRRLMHDFGVPARLLAEESAGSLDGERRLTDLLHLAELLQTASVKLDGEHALIRYLEEGMLRAAEADPDSDVARMRLESDAGLVQVVTVHKSKGLEYTLVFYPYAYHSRPTQALELPATWRNQDGVEEVLTDVAHLDDDGREKLLAQLEHERLAEDLRKLYVALTRARHATWIALAPVDTLATSAVAYLLADPVPATPSALEEALDRLGAECGAIRVEPFPEADEGRLAANAAAAMTPRWRDMRRRIEQRWSMSSYSALASMAIEGSGRAAGLHPDVTALALPDEARLDAFQEAYLAGLHTDGLAEVEPVSDPSGIHAFPRGAAPGSFMHGLLEWVFRQGPERVLTDPAELHGYVVRRCRSRGWESHAEALASWLLDFCAQSFRLPLPDGGDSEMVPARLSNYIQEMEFWFGVQEVDLRRMDAIITSHVLPGMPRPFIDHGRLNGLLRGFVDLVFEHEGRHYVADYKSNWLGPSAQAYATRPIVQAILSHRYDLQAALYLYALHRHLQSRLGPEYDYDRDVGGALIFFVRGHRAPGQGLFVEKPPITLMEELDAVFRGGNAERMES